MIIASSGSSSKHPEPSSSPTLTFFGPDNNSQIHAVHPATGQEVARFHIDGSTDKHFTISRVLPSQPSSPPIPICTADKHGPRSIGSLSYLTLKLHNQEVTIEESEWDSSMKVEAPVGRFRWRKGGDKDVLNMLDEAKTVIAKADLKVGRLDVFVVGDEQFLDLVVCSCVGVLRRKAKKGKDGEKVDAFVSGMDAASSIAQATSCAVM